MKYFAVYFNLLLAFMYAMIGIIRHDAFDMAFAVWFLAMSHFLWDYINRREYRR